MSESLPGRPSKHTGALLERTQTGLIAALAATCLLSIFAAQTLLWIAIVVLIQVTYVGRDASGPQSAHSPWPSRLGRVSTWAICAGLAATSVWPFVAPGGIARLHDQLVRGRTCLVNDCLADDACLERLHPSAARVRAITIHLKDRGATFLRAPQPHETQCGQGDAVDHRERSEGSSSPARTGQ